MCAVARRGLRHAPRFLLNAAITALGGRGAWQAALRLLSWMERRAEEDGPECAEGPTEHTYAAFFGACGCGASLGAARRVWRRLTPRGALPRSTRVCTALVAAFGRGGEATDALALFDRMAWEQVPRSTHTFNAALAAAARTGAWEAALEVFREFDGSGADGATAATPDAYSLALAVTACERGGQGHRGLALAMSPAGAAVRLDAAAAAAVMTSAGRAGRLDVARATLARLAQCGGAPSTWVYNALLSGLATSGGLPEARRVLATMRATAGCAPDARSYTALAEAARRGGTLADVRGAVDELFAAGLRPTAVTLTVVLTALGDAGAWREARSLAAEWPRRYGFGRNAYAYNALLRACTRAGQPGEALAVFRESQAARVLPTSVTFAHLIRALEAAGMRAEADEMRALRDSLAALALLSDSVDVTRVSASGGDVDEGGADGGIVGGVRPAGERDARDVAAAAAAELAARGAFWEAQEAAAAKQAAAATRRPRVSSR